MKAFPSTSAATLCAETKIPPLSLRRTYLTSRFLFQPFSICISSTIFKIQYINSQWIFTHWCLPLLWSQATIFLKCKQKTLLHSFILLTNLSSFFSEIYFTWSTSLDYVRPTLNQLSKLSSQSHNTTVQMFFHFFTYTVPKTKAGSALLPTDLPSLYRALTVYLTSQPFFMWNYIPVLLSLFILCTFFSVKFLVISN